MNERNTLYSDDSDFLGTVQNETKETKFFTLSFLSRLTSPRRKGWIRRITADDASDPHHRNCTVTFELMPHFWSDDNTLLSKIRMLIENADRFEYYIRGGIIHLSLTVYDVWSDGKPFKRFTDYLSEEELAEIDRMVDEDMDALTPEEIDEILNL